MRVRSMVPEVVAELRKHRRFSVALPAKVRVTTGATPELAAVAQDISSGGVYLVMAHHPQPGSGLEFEITLPGEISGGKIFRLRCRGKVLRVNRQQDESNVGVAAKIEVYEFAAGE